MSNLNHANINLPIEQIIHVAYSAVHLSVWIKLQADSHPNLLPYNLIIAKCTMNDTVIQESTMIKEAESTWWELPQSIKISIEIPSFKLSILSRYPGHDDHFLAQTEFQTESWISRLVAHDHDRAVSFTSDCNPDKASVLSNLCSALKCHFQLLKDSRDLDQAIKLENDVATLADAIATLFVLNSWETWMTSTQPFQLQSSQSLLPPKEAHGNLTRSTPSLFASFNGFVSLANLMMSSPQLKWGRRAFSLTAEGDTVKFMALDIVASSLLQCSVCLDKSNDLEESITEWKKALDLIPEGFPQRFIILQNLCTSLQARFSQFGKPVDLDEAIVKGTDAVNAAPSSSPDKLKVLVTLSGCLHSFLKTKDASNLDEAVSTAHDREHLDNLEESITCGKKSLSCIPDDDSFKAFTQFCLGHSLALRFFSFKNPLDGEEAISLFKSSALVQTGQPSTRLEAAVNWAQLCRKVDFPSALEAYKVALDLLPRVAWTGQSIAARHREIAEAIHCDKADTALEWLEMGQAIVWGQLHNLCSPVDFLSDAHPDLARKLSQVGNALEKAMSRDVDTENFKELTMEERAKEHCCLATERDSLVETVRALPGFEDFLQPKKLATLKNAAKLGPVILLNTLLMKCDALILIPGLDNVMHILLKDFSHEKAEPVYGHSNKDVFMNVLKELWTSIVKPVLNSLAFFVQQENCSKIKEQANGVHVEYLRGEEVTPDKVISKSFPDADFAYLSTCQTATGDEALSEESVHLVAGMLMAGYQSVIVTLWSIRDVDAPLIADEVYSQLFEDGEPDSGNAAITLHHAVQSLRNRVEDEPDSMLGCKVQLFDHANTTLK
ncbi:hypothetical protein F5146DRAFT_1004283 [Armillaria mellea]|nr:hypothetical protein F5146DRAFT_1004283 [Armillaria mellea]